MTDPLFLTEKQAARILGVHHDTLRKWRKAGQIGYRTLPNGRIRYGSEDLFSFAKATKVEPKFGHVLR